jgi:ABC-type antimicrobial peptide transport system permease subunit
LGHFAFTPIRVQAGSPNLFDVAISGFLKVAKQNDSSGLSVIQQLYTTRGAAGTLLGSVYEDTFQMKNDYYTPVQVRTEVDTSRFPAIEQQYVRTVALMDVAPVFALSKFRAGGDGSSQSGDMVVSLPSLLDLGRNATLKTQSIRSYPIRKAIFDTNGMTESQIKKLKDGLNAVVASAPGVGLSDLQDSLAALLQGVGILQIFFSFTILIAMVMCFFSLTSSMFTNIYEQSKEIGILRAVGCKRHFIIRLYVYEAFVLVVASSFLGIMIGVVVGYTMVIQRALFTQLPIPFVFPYFYVAVVVFFAIIFALLAAFSPARKMSREGIVATLRRING